LLYFRDKKDNEVGGFGITDPEDLLFVKDFITVKQQVTCASVKFDDEAVADLFEEQVDLGRKPEQFARIWLHTHPGDMVEPSFVDEETFERVFGKCQWAVMFILAQNNKTYSKLTFNVGPRGEILIPAEVNYGQDFAASDKKAWDTEYEANIQSAIWQPGHCNGNLDVDFDQDFESSCMPHDLLGDFEEMTPAERQYVLDELADRPDLWDEESEVMCL